MNPPDVAAATAAGAAERTVTGGPTDSSTLTGPAPTGGAPVAVTETVASPLASAVAAPGHRWSLRLRLMLANVLILTGTLLLSGLLLYTFLAWNLEREINESLPQQYNQIRDSTSYFFVVDRAGNITPGTNLQPDVFGSETLDVFIQIAGLDGTIPRGGRSSNLGELRLPLPPAVLQTVRDGNTLAEEIMVGSARARLYSGPLYGPTPHGRDIIGVIQVARSLEQLDERLGLLRWAMLAIGLVSLTVAAVSGLAVATAALRPLDRLAQAARDIGRSRDFSRRVSETQPNDEVGQLARTFNEMLAQLQQAHNGLASSLEAQRRFVADASHELRTPLTTIRGNVGLLRRVSAVTPTDREAALADIETEAERMSRLVNQMLSLARADAGLTLTMRPVDLDAIVQEVGRQLTLLAGAQGLVASSGPVEPSRVNGDADALKQLVLILVDNAVKYTPAPGQIRLTLTHRGEQAEIRVADTGIGIAADQLPRIFDRFYRADAARSGGGSGLGLSIARWIVEAHGGHIDVQSQLGVGTTFLIRLPLAF